MSSDGREDPRRPLREISYGGVVVRTGAGTSPEIVAIVPRGRTTLTLPKGGANARESGEDTAVREIREETGLVARVRAPLGDVEYWYRRGGRRVFKTVHFFLCDYVSGTTDDHDHEVDEARWVPLDEASRVLSFPGERRLVAEAARLLADSTPER